jgi:hypothetical protein
MLFNILKLKTTTKEKRGQQTKVSQTNEKSSTRFPSIPA